MLLWFDRKAEIVEASQPLKWPQLPRYDARFKSQNTRLYLAYGSNLCESVFQDNRGIQPISAVNVLVPELQLVWNLPGIPYAEPCYANAQRRLCQNQSLNSNEKPLVGVVYEISEADFAHVLRTEGQGYIDTEVECFRLEQDRKSITTCPDELPFRAHTVLTTEPTTETSDKPRQHMQPSNRYLSLLVTGAREHRLPLEYIISLQSVGTYEASTARKRIGKSLFSFFWFVPVFVAVVLERRMADEHGRIPEWVNRAVSWCFSGMWWTHRFCFKPIFGDGASMRSEAGDGSMQFV
ncbi:hypothetical protein K505DRAFT_249986 [Melanomma pulvis-pyrius CBS 109.77]|uniref:gamma-glutamylcyclotransferase n=1 Tax=Melanomma pulvis-pyrius CBS 109.77 TaxID=1314802 RepID=A0A6A6X4A9_9PLEO|nr:hypothetical protein K505DRAFT_249986 [Melanomma pulvis-pyrius CBS 109.77]